MSMRPLSVMQDTLTKLVAVTAATLLCNSAMATFITLETRATNNGVNQADFAASWFAQTSAIQSSSLDEFGNTRAPGSHQHSRLSIGFDYDGSSNPIFEFAPDAGFGGALYINNLQFQQNSTDMWWGYNWNRTSEIFDTFGAELMFGLNTIELYWAEACCNGGQSGRISVNGGQDWMALSVDNLERMAVPEPGVLMLLSSGLLGLGFARRKKNS